MRKRMGNLLVLDYPNEEVLSSMAYLCLYSKLDNTDVGVTRSYLEQSFDKGQPEDLIPYFNQVLAAIPYDIYERERKYSEAHSSIIMNNLAESFSRHALHSYLGGTSDDHSGKPQLPRTQRYRDYKKISIIILWS